MENETIDSSRSERAIELLKQHKRRLLEELHDSAKKVDLADLLMYRLNHIDH